MIPTASLGYSECMEHSCKGCRHPCRIKTKAGYAYKVRCPDCGNYLLKVTENTEGTLIAWCSECEKEKIIKL